MVMPIDDTDYSVLVKRRAPPPKPWKWEIYRAGRSGAIEQSAVYFETMATASKAAKEALKLLVAKLRAEHLRQPASLRQRPMLVTDANGALT
jgi:hypothetical protein